MCGSRIGLKNSHMAKNIVNIGGGTFNSLSINPRANRGLVRRIRTTRGPAQMTEKAITDTKGLERVPNEWSERIWFLHSIHNITCFNVILGFYSWATISWEGEFVHQSVGPSVCNPFLIVSHDSIRGYVGPLVGPSVMLLLAGRDEPANDLFRVYKLVFLRAETKTANELHFFFKTPLL